MKKQQRDRIARTAARVIAEQMTTRRIAKKILDDVFTVNWEIKFKALKNGEEELIK